MVERAHPLLVAILAAVSGCTNSYEGQGCMKIPLEQMSCPSRSTTPSTRLTIDSPPCEQGPCEIVGMLGEGKRLTRPDPPVAGLPTEALCCYPVKIIDHEENEDVAVGRPYHEDGASRVAPLLPLAGSAQAAEANAWASAGAGEHASIAAFSRLTLELMAHGAPTALLVEAQRAALDEARHAEACWAFARELGLDFEVGAFPFREHLRFDTTLDEIAAATVRDGCVAETLGALLLAAAAQAAPREAVRSALSQMASAEAQHAVFAFRIVAWAIARGGAPVRAAVEKAFTEACYAPGIAALALRTGVHPDKLREALAGGIAEVLYPATRALLGAA
jgi:hypothetical protein